MKRLFRFSALFFSGMLCAVPGLAQSAAAPPSGMKRIDAVPASYTGPIAAITYFKAKPGQIDAYSKWTAETAKAVDDWAQEHGAFESVTTYVLPVPDGPWTHMRIFMFKSREQMQGMGKVMDAAHKAVFPDPEKREQALGHKEDMRTSLTTSYVVEVIR
jgi:hypothetical protein